MKILVVEQPRRSALSLGGLLQALGYDVLQRSDWRLVRELARRERVAVALVDACLPGLEEEKPTWMVPRAGANPPRLILFGEHEQERVERLGLSLGTTQAFGCEAPDAAVLRAVEDALRDWKLEEARRGPDSAVTVPPRPGQPATTLASRSGERRVLVADEDTRAGDLARRALDPGGYLVKWAGSWPEITGELLAAPACCGVILLAPDLPTISTREMVDVIRETHTVSPVILIWSDLRSVELDELAQQAGADGYLRKTEDAGLLLGRVKYAYEEFSRRVDRALAS